MFVRRNAARQAVIICFFLTLLFATAECSRAQTSNFSPAVLAQANVPKEWQKNAIPRFSANGLFVEGIVYARPWKQWTWKPASGFVMGKALTIEQADVVRDAPMSAE